MIHPVTDRLEQYLDVLAGRQRLVASNIANIDTPGYQTKDLDFQAELSRASSRIGPTEPVSVTVPGLLTKPDGNNVSLDRENRLLAENTIRFQGAASLLRAHLRQLRSAIKEGQG